MNIIEKKKKPYSSKTTTTGDIQKNIDHFNKMLVGKAENTHTDGYLNGTFISQSPDGASSISAGGEGGGMGESLEINEAKRYVRRYLIKPQNIFCSSKNDIIKALIDIGNENCSVYTLINLKDNDDITKLTNKDIIYYYDDGVLYDKNRVKVMDYDLYVKHEEQRDKINIDKVSDATFNKVYDDRMTDQTDLDEVLELSERYEYLTPDNLDELIDMAKINCDNQQQKDDLDKLQAGNGSVLLKQRTTGAYSGERDFGKLNKIFIANNNIYFNWTRDNKYSMENSIDDFFDRINVVGYGKTLLRIIRDSAKALNRQKNPGVKARRNENARRTLTDEIANELRDHIVNIKFRIPDENDEALYPTDDADIDVVEAAREKIREIIESFNEKPFAEEADKNGYVETRKIKQKYKQDSLENVVNNWALIGLFMLDCDVSELSENTQDWISAVKAKDKSKTEKINGKYVSCFRALSALIEHFNNDVNFFKNKRNETHELDLNFDDVNAFGEQLVEGKEVNGTCCICGEDIIGYGNNPEPYMSAENGERCCDACNMHFVIPARLEVIKREED